MFSIRIRSFAVVFIWQGWKRLYFTRLYWYVHKWRYVDQTSWRHGTVGLGPLKVAW